jgi:flagellum-specific peptidoglycan hydrolase FlgJ
MLRSASRLLLAPVLALAASGAALLIDTTAASAATTSAVRVSGKLKVRSGPSNSAKVVRQLKNKQKITIDCRVNGQYVRGPVRKTAQWDHIAGTGQYVSHAYVVSKAAIPVCQPPPTPQPAVDATSVMRSPLAVPAGPVGTVNTTVFIHAYAQKAMASQNATGVPAAVTMAQAILESGWGKSQLTSVDNNFFGVKCATQSPNANGCRVYNTTECNSAGVCLGTPASFRTYPSATESFTDHGLLLKNAPRYATAMSVRGDANAFATEIWRAGYATDPTYPTKLINIMDKYHLKDPLTYQ